MKIGQEAGRWFSAHLWKTDFKAVGRTEEDVKQSFDQAVASGEVVKKRWGLPFMEKSGLSIHETSLTALKFKEITYKLSTIIPAIGGLAFLSQAYTILRESGGHGPEGAIGGLMGVIGLAAITFGQYLAWENGDIYGRMYDWADKNGIKNPIQGTQYWPGNQS